MRQFAHRTCPRRRYREYLRLGSSEPKPDTDTDTVGDDRSDSNDICQFDAHDGRPRRHHDNRWRGQGTGGGRRAEGGPGVRRRRQRGDEDGAYGARDEVTASSCAWCARKKSFVTAIYRGGGHIQGELFTKNTFTVTDPTKGVYTVVVNTTVSKYREVSGSGKVLDSHGDRTGLLVVHVSGSTLKVVFASWQPGS